MNVCIDVSRLVDKPLTGVGKYIKNLVNAISIIDSENDYYLSLNFPYCLTNSPIEILKELKVGLNFHFINLSPNSLDLNNFETYDIVHSPNITSPKFEKARLITTIHDMTCFINPEWHTKENVDFSIRQTNNAVKYASKIIVPSENTAYDLCRYFNLDKKFKEDKIRIVPEAPAQEFYPERDLDNIERTLKKYGIYKNYLLGVFTIEPRKNTYRLIKAFDMVAEKEKDVFLVLTGKVGWKVDLKDYLGKISHKDRIIFTGYVSDDELRCLYTACKIFIYPSLYEGFGLPVVEAMACGAPVVTSGISSLPEIVEDAAILVDPYNVESIAGSIENMLEDDGLRKSYRRKGNKLVRKKFSWEKTARMTLEVYEESFK